MVSFGCKHVYSFRLLTSYIIWCMLLLLLCLYKRLDLCTKSIFLLDRLKTRHLGGNLMAKQLIQGVEARTTASPSVGWCRNWVELFCCMILHAQLFSWLHAGQCSKRSMHSIQETQHNVCLRSYSRKPWALGYQIPLGLTSDFTVVGDPQSRVYQRL